MSKVCDQEWCASPQAGLSGGRRKRMTRCTMVSDENRKKILALVRLHGLNVIADAVEIIDLAMT